MNFLKKHIHQLPAYRVPQTPDCTKLNQNESPYDIPQDLKERICVDLGARAWNRYPQDECLSLLNSLSRYAGLPAAAILVGNSSNELIQTVIYSACDSGDGILVVRPTFSVYRRVAAIMGVKVVEVPLNRDFSFNTEAIIGKMQQVKMVILASPNNPTGTVIPLSEIAQLTQLFKGLVVVDEAYFEFHRQTARDLIDKYSNLVVLRTFSKALSLAGLRLGYLLGQPQVVQQLKKAKLPFSVGLFQQVVGEAILNRQAFVQANVRRIILGREHLFKRLAGLPGIDPVPSNTNFILFRTSRVPAAALFQALLQQGVLLRCFDSGELKNYLRVNVGTDEENRYFLGRIENLLEELDG
jgi:histidinol-phosphate aminotransferase